MTQSPLQRTLSHKPKNKNYQGAIKVKTPTRKKVGWPADFLSSGMMRFTRALCSEINPRRPSLRRHQGSSGSARNQGECPALLRGGLLPSYSLSRDSVITVGGSFIFRSSSSWEDLHLLFGTELLGRAFCGVSKPMTPSSVYSLFGTAGVAAASALFVLRAEAKSRFTMDTKPFMKPGKLLRFFCSEYCHSSAGKNAV